MNIRAMDGSIFKDKMSSNSLENLSIEELMRLAQVPLKEKEDKNKHLSEVRRFIISDNVKSGDYPIPSSLIYERYIKWSKIHNTPTQSLSAFMREFKRHFKKKRLATGWVYYLSPEGFDLSIDSIRQAAAKQKRISRGKKKKED